MRDDERVSVLVIDRDDPQRYVSVSGRVRLDHEGEGEAAEAHIDKLAKKYMGLDSYPDEARWPGETRVIGRITPEKVMHLNLE